MSNSGHREVEVNCGTGAVGCLHWYPMMSLLSVWCSSRSIRPENTVPILCGMVKTIDGFSSQSGLSNMTSIWNLERERDWQQNRQHRKEHWYVKGFPFPSSCIFILFYQPQVLSCTKLSLLHLVELLEMSDNVPCLDQVTQEESGSMMTWVALGHLCGAGWAAGRVAASSGETFVTDGNASSSFPLKIYFYYCKVIYI